ncbi:hypothetical protein [Actinoplanes sp. GCM10030250]|uniref:hypothetical protein n=1 Tax=Actinoplanes sp. GCM10030250 TaxID=3273376 RepID=UPI00361D5608
MRVQHADGGVAVAVATVAPGPVPLTVAATGLGCVAAAETVLRRARARRAELTTLARRLEQG